MKSRLKLGAVVCLNDVHPKWSPSHHLVGEFDRRALVARIVHFQHANARAVVDGGELIEPLWVPGMRSRNATSICRRCPGCGFSYRVQRFVCGWCF